MKSNRAKHIVIFSWSMQTGGGEAVLLALMNGFLEKKHKVTLVLCQQEGEMLQFINPRVEVVVLHAHRFVVALRKIISYLKQEKPDVIFSSSLQMNLVLIVARLCSRVTTKVIIRVGSPLSSIFQHQEGAKNYIVSTLARIFYIRADHIIAVSRGIADDIRKNAHVPEYKMKIIHGPKDIQKIKDMSEEYIPDIFNERPGPFVLCVGRMTGQKDMGTLITAFQHVVKEIPQSTLVFVGDGGDRKSLEEQVTGASLGSAVAFEGRKDNPFVYMSQADVLVLPSLWEGYPNVLTEGLICGVKNIVATDSPVGGSREILAPDSDYKRRLTDSIEKGRHGWLVPTGHPEFLAKAIITSMKEKKEKIAFDIRLLDSVNDYIQLF